MTQRVEALVKPELLIWGREDAGYALEEAAKKAAVLPERLAAWERGEQRPTIAQLRKLAKVYKRPLAVFFLPRPPKKFQAMHDFRRLTGQNTGQESPALRFAITRVRYRRGVALDLFDALGVKPEKLSASASISENPEMVASRARGTLRITESESERWRTPYDAFNAWRDALENRGILVFQVQGVDVSEMRGFSISGSLLPAIAINIKDAVNGRIFTALHEFAHLMLREAGICDLTENSLRSSMEQRVEIFCNHVAGAILVPMASLIRESLVKEHGGQESWSDFELQSLARKFSTSREVVLRRLLIAGLTTSDFYQAKASQYQREYEESRGADAGFAPPSAMAVSSAGPMFTRLVLESYYREAITSSYLSEYLDVRLRHIPKIEELIMRKSALRESAG